MVSHMTGKFLSRSRHGTIYYFRRRVPTALQEEVGQPFLVKSLQTADRRIAIVRARALAARTDAIFQKIEMAKNPKTGPDVVQVDYEMFIDIPGIGSIRVEAEPHEQEASSKAARKAMEDLREVFDGQSRAVLAPVAPSALKPFSTAVQQYYKEAQIKPQSKATYRSRLNHAQAFFGDSHDVMAIDQTEFFRYCTHVRDTIKNKTTQGLYMANVATFLNWHRHVRAGLPPLTTKSLIPKRTTPEAEDRDAFTLEQLRFVFQNAKRYRNQEPHKFWASIATPFLGCRIEELCQIHLMNDFIHDEEASIYYLRFDERPDDDGVVRKSVKKVSSWRSVPIHSALVRHGFVDFLFKERAYGAERPFQRGWKPREKHSEDTGMILKWSHYVSRWGGAELRVLAHRHGFERGTLTYFHSMRHAFKRILGEAGVATEISEALSGRRYAGPDAERYDKLKRNHRRLSIEGIESGLNALVKLLDETM